LKNKFLYAVGHDLEPGGNISLTVYEKAKSAMVEMSPKQAEQLAAILTRTDDPASYVEGMTITGHHDR